MARVFTQAAGNYLEATLFPSVSLPFTVAYWFYATDTTSNHRGWSASKSSGVAYYFVAPRGDQPGDPVQAIADVTMPGTGIASTTAAYSANTWHHACGVFSSTTSRIAYLDGGNKGIDTTSVTVSGVDRFDVGAFYYSGTRYAGFGGRIAYLAMWGAALSDAEVAELAARYHPRKVRPSSLLGCWDLGGFSGEHDKDFVGGYNLTAYNTPTWADSPGIIWPDDGEDVITAAPVSSNKPWLYVPTSARLIGA